MNKRIATAVLTVVMSAAMIPTAMPVMAQEVAVEQSEATTAFSSYAKIATFQGENVSFNGQDQKPTFSVTTIGNEPVDSSEYTVSYKKGNDTVTTCRDAGTYTLVLTPKDTNKYSGTITRNFTINKSTPKIVYYNSYTQTYDGTAKTFPYTVLFNNVEISNTGNDLVDVSCTYKQGKDTVVSPTEPGTYNVTITAGPKSTDDKDNIGSATINASLVINKINLNEYTVRLSNANAKNEITYTGDNVISSGAVQFKDGCGATASIPEADYTVSPSTATNIGSYTLTATAKSDSAHYTGSAKSFGFSIVKSTDTTGLPFTSTEVSVDTLPAKTWTGSPVTFTTSGSKPELVVKYNGVKLTAGTDYTVSYKNNTDVGSSAQVIIKGAAKYQTTEVSFTFSIRKKPLASSMITLNKTSYDYSGSAIEPNITVRDGNKVLTKDTDYTITYPDNNNTNAGKDIRVFINGTGDKYTGTIQRTFTINPHTLTSAEVELSQNVFTVNGTANTNVAAQTPSATISPKVGRVASFTLSNGSSTNGVSISYTNNTKAGTATATITGSGNYAGTVTKNFTIVVQNPNATTLTSGNTTISDIPAVTYNGTHQKPGVTVKYNGVALRSGTDYTLTYGMNTEVGSGSVTVTGINGYKGSLNKTFEIKQAQISIVSIASIPSQEYTGGEVKPALSISYAGQTLREGTDYRVYYSNNINKGTASARIQGLKNFTGETTRTFSIVDKKDIAKQVWATGFTLPETATVVKGGTVRVNATFTPANADASTIRWSTSNSAFPFSDGYTAKTTQNESGIDVKANAEGSTIITATLYDENSKEIGTQYTLVKTEKQFSDVPQDYYTNAVNTLANYGYTTGSGSTREWHATPVINGTSSTTFTPSGDVTRAQFVMMLYNKAVADYKAGKTSTDPSKAPASNFTDVTSYTEAINWAVANGITFGKGNNTFDPNGTVTRAEAVAFLQRYMKGGNASTTKFTDVKNDAYYAGAVGWAVNNGITAGTSNTTFSPQQKCNRAQAATFIYRTVF